MRATLLLLSGLVFASAGIVLAGDPAHLAHPNHEHEHSDDCGHKKEKHGDHEDYVHGDHHHKKHDGHYDECDGDGPHTKGKR